MAIKIKDKFIFTLNIERYAISIINVNKWFKKTFPGKFCISIG